MATFLIVALGVALAPAGLLNILDRWTGMTSAVATLIARASGFLIASTSTWLLFTHDRAEAQARQLDYIGIPIIYIFVWGMLAVLGVWAGHAARELNGPNGR